MINEIQIIEKPKLIILEEKTKLRDYKPEVLNTLTFELVKKLLDLVGSNDGKSDHHISLINFIKDCYGHYTFEEIKHAFDLFVSGEFEHKPYQQLNAVVFGRTMREYEIHKRNKLESYRRKKRLMADKPTKEQQEQTMNDAVNRLHLEFKNTGKISGTISHVYDFLDSQGKLQGDRSKDEWKKYKIEVFSHAKAQAKSEKMTEASSDISIHRALPKIIRDIESGDFDGLKTMSKRIVLMDYFKGLNGG